MARAGVLKNVKSLARLFQFREVSHRKTGCISILPACRNYSTGKFSTSIPEFEDNLAINSYKDLYQFSLTNSEEFWSTLARSRLRWFKDFGTVKDCDINEGRIAWFLDGKLNVSGR